MKFSKAIVILASLFLFDQAAAAVVTSTRSADGSVHVVIPFGNGDDNGNDRKKERELETTAHNSDARFLNGDGGVTVPYGPGGLCNICDGDYERSDNFFGNWNNGERDFVDPLNASVGGMKVEVFGVCGESPIEVSLNGNVLGQVGNFDSCLCGDCNSSSGFFTFDYQWYNVGVSNTIRVRATNIAPDNPFPYIVIARVELDLYIASMVPSDIPSSEPSWLDDEQCKKKDPGNNICAELDGRCKVDCEDDEDFVCVPGLCSYDRNWEKPTKSPKMRELKEEKVDVVDIEVTADGSTERKLKGTKDPSTKETKATKAPKGTKAPKSSCECRVPRNNRGCEN